MKLFHSLRSFAASSILSIFSVCVAPVLLTAAPYAKAAAIVASVPNLPDFTDLVERTGSAVVNIRTTEKVKSSQTAAGMPDDEEMQEFFKRFFGVPMPRQPQPNVPNSPKGRKAPAPDEEQSRGVGSGFIVSADGYVMTNAHVVDGADEVYVTLTDKREFKAKIIGADKRSDVALVKIEGVNLPRLTIGDSNKIRVGEWVIAIGSPFGLDNTVTAGIVSAKARDTGDYLPLIQTDVAVNPGNSGGPLINMRGEVVGINSQIYSRSGGYMGISFAVPIDEAMRVSDQLKTTGRVTRGRIGVQIGEVTKDVSDSLGMPRPQGAFVSRVEPAGPAEKAGVEAGDIILKFNGVSIEKASDLPRMVGNIKPGTKSVLTVWRKGTSRDLNLVVTELEPEKSAKRDDKKQKPEASANSLGLVVSDLTEVQRKELKIDGGVLVDVAEGAAARAGFRPGDIALRLNDVDIKDVKQFNSLVVKLEMKKVVRLLVRRGDSSQFLLIRP